MKSQLEVGRPFFSKQCRSATGKNTEHPWSWSPGGQRDWHPRTSDCKCSAQTTGSRGPISCQITSQYESLNLILT